MTFREQDKQAAALLVPAAILLGVWVLAHATVPSDGELWRRFEAGAAPGAVDPQGPRTRDFDRLVLRGAFGRGGIPPLDEVLRDRPAWRQRVDVLFLRESQGLR